MTSATQHDRPTRTLRTALGRRGVTEAILSGEVTPEHAGWELELHEVTPLPRAFRMMVNQAAFDVAEMALTTLAMAVEHGRPMVGIPAVLNRDFHYRSIVVRTGSDVRVPSDLVGRRVGVRAYSQTTGVWARGLLADDYDVAPESVRWVTFESAHVEEYVDPTHVERAPEGATLAGMLASGDLDAAVIMDPDLDPTVARPLFGDQDALARAAYARTGVYPVNHVLAVDTRVLDALPGLPGQLLELLGRSRESYLARLRTDGPRTRQDRHVLALGDVVGGDPNPFGLEANRRSCEELLRHAHRQGLLARPMGVRDLFHPSFF